MTDKYIVPLLGDEKEEIQSSRFVRSNTLTSDNSQLTRKTVKLEELPPNEGVEVAFWGKNTKKEISMTLEVLENNLNLSRFEVILMNAIGTLWEAGNRFLTAHRIYSLLSGNKAKQASPTTEHFIDTLLENLSRVKIEIDRTEFLEESGYEGELLLKGPLVMYDEVIHILNNKRSKAYLFYRMPLLYQNAREIKQTYSLESNILSLPEGVRTLPENIVLNAYLFDRVNAMCINPKLHRIIDVNNLYSYFEQEKIKLDSKRGKTGKKLTPKQKRTVKENAIAILEHFVSEGAISGFEYEGDGRARNEKFTITLPKKF